MYVCMVCGIPVFDTLTKVYMHTLQHSIDTARMTTIVPCCEFERQ